MKNTSNSHTLILYVHGKGGTADEAAHYIHLFPDCDVIGLPYHAETPWAAKEEFPVVLQSISEPYHRIILIANSIGAYFSMCAMPQEKLQAAYFISPIVNMETLICNMMRWANVSESDLQTAGTITTSFGETLSWDYLRYVRSYPLRWTVPTKILYGDRDHFTDLETMTSFAKAHHADLTVLQGYSHWFHTPEQMALLDHWIRQNSI